MHSQTTLRFSYYTAIVTAAVAAITLAIAVMTPPLSGPYSPEGCVEYPYTDIASRFPRDYWWMYSAMLLNILFVVFMACIHQHALPARKIYSTVALALAMMSSTTLLIVYFVQVSVIQPSLLNGETEGIAMLSQYNPHGVFIAMEELGYLLMSLAFLFAAPVFGSVTKTEKAVRFTFFINFVLVMAALIYYSLAYGIHREYRFEVAVISIDWLALIAGGMLVAKVFNRAAP